MAKQTESSNEAMNKATTEQQNINEAPEVSNDNTYNGIDTNTTNKVIEQRKIINHRGLPERLINTMEEVKSFAEMIAASSTWSAPFECSVKAEDGSITTSVNVGDIIGNIILAREIGLSPMQGIAFGKTLNRQAVIKAQYGKELGVNVLSAIKDIHIWDGGNKEIVYVGIGIVNGVLLSLGVKTIIDEYPNMSKVFCHAKSNEPVEYDPNKHINIEGIDGATLKKALDDGKKPVLMKYCPSKIVAKVRLVRGDNAICIPYSLQDAIDAGLMKGITSDGNEVNGKDNWIKHPKTMLIHKSTMNGARIIAADKLNGIYIPDELDFKTSYNDDNIEETQYEEIHT